jgi:small subunit ribosomal protein S18
MRLNASPPPRKRQTVGPGAREARAGDIFYQLNLDPLEECQNATLLAHFVSEMGKIYGRERTRLTTNNQRRLGKAIRRARQMGVLPILSRPWRPVASENSRKPRRTH